MHLGKELFPEGGESPVACPEEQLIAPRGGAGEVEGGGSRLGAMAEVGGRTLNTKGRVDGSGEDTLRLKHKQRHVKVVSGDMVRPTSSSFLRTSRKTLALCWKDFSWSGSTLQVKKEMIFN